MRGTRGTVVAVALAFLALPVTRAQEASPSYSKPPKLGPIEIGAAATVTGKYSDNVFSTENDRIGDFITVLAPELTLQTRTEDLKLDLNAEAEIGTFASQTSEDYFDAKLSAEGEWNLTEEIFLFGGLDHAWEHEERDSPDDAGGKEPVEYREASGFAGISTDFGAATARLGVNFRRFDFDDTPVSGGDPINNDDRDRLQSEFGARVGYKLGKGREAFAQGVYDLRDYEDGRDDFGFDRDSKGFNAAVGYRGEFGPFRAEALIGFLHQNYDDPAFGSLTAPDFGAELSWRPEPATRLSLNVDRRLEETTLVGSSGYLSDSAILRADRWFARDLRGDAYVGYSRSDYREIQRTDHIAEAGLGLRYYLTPNVFLRSGYGFQQRNSDVPGADYDSHSVYLQLGGSLEPAYRETTGLAAVGARGFYTGVQVGDGLLKTSLDGLRGSGGTLAAEFGDFGLAGGAFAGYRAEIGRLMLGAEIDGGLSGADWGHLGNRTFSVAQDSSIGASALVGTRIRNDVLLYSRAGAIGTEFETRYAQGGNTAKRDKREVGMRFGLGAEFPLTGSLSGRMEYGVSAYPDYDVGASDTAEPDNFSSIASFATFGVVYHFGARETSQPEPVDFGGFYAGMQAGHGGLVTGNTGPRPADEDPAFFLDVERAGMGLTGGLVAGYGETFGPFYLGAEVEGELSTAKWDIERDPTGRVYSVEKKGSVGASVRAGYVVNNSVLLYGRAGIANGWFDTDYAVGNAVSVDRADSELGFRAGGGIEFAISDKTRMRLDYTRTDYGSYKLDYGSGIDSFDNSENLFRIGITYSF